MYSNHTVREVFYLLSVIRLTIFCRVVYDFCITLPPNSHGNAEMLHIPRPGGLFGRNNCLPRSLAFIVSKVFSFRFQNAQPFCQKLQSPQTLTGSSSCELLAVFLSIRHFRRWLAEISAGIWTMNLWFTFSISDPIVTRHEKCTTWTASAILRPASVKSAALTMLPDVNTCSFDLTQLVMF